MRQRITFYWHLCIPVLIISLISLFKTDLNKSITTIGSISGLFTIIAFIMEKKEDLGFPKRLIDSIFNICISIAGSCIVFVSVSSGVIYLPNTNDVIASFLDKDNKDIGNPNETETETETDTTHITPQQLKEEIQETGKTFNPNISNDKFNQRFLTKQNNIQTINNNFAEKQLALNECVIDHIKSLFGKEKSCDYNALNRDVEYTDCIEEANRISNIAENENDDSYYEIINLREKAYNKGKTRELAILLARDYNEWADEYVRKDIKQEAFNCYIKSLDYYEESIKLMKPHTNYKIDEYTISYKIGQVFHSIGDLKNMNINIRLDSYLMSSSYLNYQSQKKSFYSSYYNGMVEHKLGILLSNDRYRFLINACNNYWMGLQCAPRKSSKINLYRFIADVNNELMIFIESNGQKASLSTSEEYKQKKDTALETVTKLMND